MSEDSSTGSDGGSTHTVESFRPTPYEDSSWRIVGEFLNQDFFEPMQFRTASADGDQVDKMFSDYGGRLGAQEGDTRPHVPMGAGVPAERRRSRAPEVSPEEEAARQQQVIEQAVEEARESAREEGRQAAQAEFDEKMRALEERYGEVLRDIGNQLNESLEGIEQQAVSLAVAISEKLVGTIVDVNPEYILEIVREALKLTGGSSIKTVRVSPQDLEFFNMVKLSKEFKQYDGSWSFQADDTVKAGCIVESSSGQVDYDISRAWQRIADQVVKVK
jgi:flagellar biosynthesis/type III secretory pathway protein FliH